MDSDFARAIHHKLTGKCPELDLNDEQLKVFNALRYLDWLLKNCKPKLTKEFLETHSQHDILRATHHTACHAHAEDMLDALFYGRNHPIREYLKSLDKMNSGSRKRESYLRNVLLRNCEAMAILLTERRLCRSKNSARKKIAYVLGGEWTSKKLEYVNHQNFPIDLSRGIDATLQRFRIAFPENIDDLGIVLYSFKSMCVADGLIEFSENAPL